jgi:prevent-host-death family protein
MRQQASDLVRRAERGERVTITVAGRPAAVLGPAASGAWRHWDDIADVFARPSDPDWATDRAGLDETVVDPWER